MKIGIITYHFTSNYGATLQAYALSHFLEQNGYDVEFIDYRPKSIRLEQRKNLYP
ncbi:MAG: polysaccharide pyruvyl transferase family protein, partial [Cyanobacteria bacterium P01_A01_bin.68]